MKLLNSWRVSLVEIWIQDLDQGMIQLLEENEGHLSNDNTGDGEVEQGGRNLGQDQENAVPMLKNNSEKFPFITKYFEHLGTPSANHKVNETVVK